MSESEEAWLARLWLVGAERLGVECTNALRWGDTGALECTELVVFMVGTRITRVLRVSSR